MKKILYYFVLAGLVMGLCACGGNASSGDPTQDAVEATRTTWPEEAYSVSSPMEQPVYSFEGEPTIDEMRAMAVKAMNDMLSIQWCTPEFIAYQKTGAVSGKKFSYVPAVTFAGLPYTNGDSAIFSWFEYYDTETGMLYYPGNGQSFNQTLGNTCTGSVMWGWSAVCHTLNGYYTNYWMTPMWGCYPVGGYYIPTWIDNYRDDYSTMLICEENGKETILEAYAQCLPADGLTSSPENHGMMVIEAPNVVRKADGSIDAEQSTMTIQDQRAGTGDFFYEQEIDGETILYSGQTSWTCSFEYLYTHWYIPVTPAEFLGEEPYEHAYVELDGSAEDLSSLVNGYLVSNYPMCVIKAVLDDGTESTVIATELLDKVDVKNGTAKKYSMRLFSELLSESGYEETLEEGKTYTMSILVTVSTGEIFTPAQITING